MHSLFASLKFFILLVTVSTACSDTQTAYELPLIISLKNNYFCTQHQPFCFCSWDKVFHVQSVSCAIRN